MTNQEIKESIKKAIETAVHKAYPDVDYPEIELDYPQDKKNGDFACNIALKLCKVVKNSPQETAEKILNEIILPTEIQKSEFAHPGFINFYLGIDYLTSRIQALINQQNIDLSSEANKTQKIIVEYSQPNIAKPLGVHHLLSTIIGQSLYNIHKSLGYDTISINHIGDWGTQFGKLIYAYRTWGDKDEIEKDPINELLKLYIKFHSESDKDPDLDDKGREEFKKLEDGDQENLKLLKWITEVSLKDVQKTYDLLGGIHFDHVQGESFYEKLMQPIIDNGIKKKIFTEGEKGALVVNYADEKLPTCLVRKSDGATLYFTRDLATIRYRTDEWNPKKILYVIDTAQSLYMRQVFKAADMLWGKENLPERTHVEFGRMSFPEGKMSTRKGTVILLFDFLKEAIEKAKDIVKEKNPEITNAEIEKIAKVIGVGSVKYAILSQNRNTNVVFTWQKMLSL
ncbi:arginine--tRNA ligase, partial [Patescibacteria group bacterium]|nr:arginine--tRNA ligase [Patescibacteria group bacterium]